jgi:hypothetical protein
MRMRSFLLAATAFLLPADRPVHAQSPAGAGCIGHQFRFVRNGTTSLEGDARGGQPCQIGFGLTGTEIETLQITVRPSHGILGASGKEANRQYIAYAPSAGYAGRDQFELHIRFTPVGGRSSWTRVTVIMNVAP